MVFLLLYYMIGTANCGPGMESPQCLGSGSVCLNIPRFWTIGQCHREYVTLPSPRQLSRDEEDTAALQPNGVKD